MPCPATCGIHVHQTRSVVCVPKNPGETASDTDCNVAERPPSMRSCKLAVCPKGEPPLGKWLIGEWTKVLSKDFKLLRSRFFDLQCSVTCGGGWRRRT
ncbi:unnamed protein product, partial [Strongylus vulgaris]